MLQCRAVTQESDQDRPPRLLSEAQVAGLTAQSGCLVVGVVLAAVVIGIWLDRALNTRPFITLALVLASLPVTFFLLYRIALQTVSTAKEKPSPAAKERNEDADAA
jgi:F0F1-type ATP synthase assembly protein I